MKKYPYKAYFKTISFERKLLDDVGTVSAVNVYFDKKGVLKKKPRRRRK